MKGFNETDLDRLANGQPIAPEAFDAILADPDAIAELHRLLQVQEFFGPEDEELDLTNVPEMTVSFLSASGASPVYSPM